MSRNPYYYQRKQTINECPGLITNINVQAVTPGALSIAENVSIRRPGIIEHRRGMFQATQFAASTTMLGLMTYQNSVLVATKTPGNLPQIADADSGANVSAGNTGPTVFGGRFAEQNGNLYLMDGATDGSGGVRKLISPTLTGNNFCVWAGTPRCLDLALSAPNPGAGYLPAFFGVAYRMLWGYIDANGNKIRGTPSGRFIFTNGASATNVQVQSRIPARIKTLFDAGQITNYFYQLYRTTATTGTATAAAADPGDAMNLVFEAYLTATDSAAGVVTMTDIFPEGINKGEDLYTNSTQDSAAFPNGEPPIGTDMVTFKGQMLISNVTGKQRSTLVLLGVPDLWICTNAVWNLGTRQLTLTLATTPAVPVAPDLSLLDGSCRVSLSGFTNAGNNNTFAFLSSSGPTNLVVQFDAGQAVGVTEVPPAGASVMSALLRVGVAGNTYDYHFFHHAAAVTYPAAPPAQNKSFFVKAVTTGLTSQNIAATTQNITAAINTDTYVPAQPVYAYYVSGPQDSAGIIQLEERSIGGVFSFSSIALGNAFANKWSPSLRQAKTASADVKANRISISKPGQPESFSPAAFVDIGAPTQPIRRMMANRESVFVFKDDGCFRLTMVGDGSAPTIHRFNDTLRLVSTSSVGLMGNDVYAICTRGVYVVNEQGSTLIDQVIHNITQGTVGAQTGVVNTKTEKLVCSEIDSTVYITLYFGGTVPYGLQYNANTQSWTQDTSPFLDMPGVYIRFSSTIYRMGALGTWKESRTGFNPGLVPFWDVSRPADGFTMSLTAVGATVPADPQLALLTYSATSNPNKAAMKVGDVVQSNSGLLNSFFIVVSVPDATHAIVQLAPWDVGDATLPVAGNANVYQPIPIKIEWHPFGGSNESATKHFREAAVLFEVSDNDNIGP